ncbi:MAG: PhnD/SsuA/transferrin family substrate-binding protein [Candidatus Hydrogenedentes bacterium]|nr:PhnD/SsuA/transferrin family substrate-binding protein [Candidatus Hydrogenedentota bacterium]
MELLAVPRIGGEIHYYSYIIVPDFSPATSLLDLRGKRFGSADLMSNTVWLYPMVWLREQGEDPKRLFGQHRITGSHDRAIEALARGHLDGVAVGSLVYDYMVVEDPVLGKTTRVILTSPPFGMPTFVTHPNTDASLREDILRIFLDMQNSEEGIEVLFHLSFEQFDLPDSEAYDGVRLAASVVARSE